MKKKSVIKVIMGALLLGMTTHASAGEIHTGCSANYTNYLYSPPSKLDCGMFGATCGQITGARDNGESKIEIIKEFHDNALNDQECRMIDQCANRVFGPWKNMSQAEVDNAAYEFCTEHPEL